MGNAAIDIHSQPVRWRQFDADQQPTRLEALLEGDCESAADDFVAWLADEKQREELYYLIVDRLEDDDVKRLAKAWAEMQEAV